IAKEFDLKENSGALVGDVTPKSPAEKAGVKSGDVITEYNGKKVTDSRNLKLEAARTTPGQKVPMTILRDGKTKNLEVVVKEMPGTEHLAKNDQSSKEEDTGTLNGVAVSDLDNRAR